MGTRRGRMSGWVAATGLLLAGAGLIAYVVQAPTGTTAVDPGAGTTPGRPAADGGATIEPRRARWEPGAPHRVAIPALGVDAPVVPIKTVGDTLVPPADPRQLGWWAGGAKPGSARGSALVTGHTVNAGGGALDDLEALEPGDPVAVRTGRGRVVYVVDRVRVFSKGRVAEHAERLFSQDVPGRLVLITCEDWNGERYLSNVVVTATPS